MTIEASIGLTLGPKPQLCETLRLGLKRIETCPTVTNPTLGVALVAKTRMTPAVRDSDMDHALFSDGTMESSKEVSVSISLKRASIKFDVDRRQAVGVLPDCFSASPSPPPHLPFSLPRPTQLVPAVHRARPPVLRSPPHSGEVEGGKSQKKKRRHDIIPATPPPAASNSPTTNLFRRHWASFDGLDVFFKPAPSTAAANKLELTIQSGCLVMQRLGQSKYQPHP